MVSMLAYYLTQTRTVPIASSMDLKVYFTLNISKRGLHSQQCSEKHSLQLCDESLLTAVAISQQNEMTYQY